MPTIALVFVTSIIIGILGLSVILTSRWASRPKFFKLYGFLIVVTGCFGLILSVLLAKVIGWGR